MISLRLEEIAAIVGGRVISGDGATTVSRVSIDSRAVSPGDLFVGVRGDRFDGSFFAAEAVARGAAAVLVSREAAPAVPLGSPCVAVIDGSAALTALAGSQRRRSSAKVVAITGSAGKTSTKDILAALLRPVADVVATPGNFNNEVGVPLTLLQCTPTTEVVVCELAMRGPGQIAWLADLTAPDIGIITNIAPVHLEIMGTIEAVAAAKSELITALADRPVVVPAGEPLLQTSLTQHTGRTVTFGPRGDVWLAAAEPRDGGTHALIDAFGRRVALWFNFTGGHYLTDALAAVAAFLELGHRLEDARAGAAAVTFSAHRGEVVRLGGDGLLLDDAYNANPTASVAALEHLAALAGRRPKVALLGDMLELGPRAAEFHRAVGERASELDIRVVAVGESARGYLCGVPNEVWRATVEAALAALPQDVPPGSAVLVKGSRGMRMERLAEQIRSSLAPQPDPPHSAGRPVGGEDPRD